MSHRIERITEVLEEKLSPDFLEVIDDSADHAGHAGASTGMGHFTIKISSAELKTLSLIEAHRLVYGALGKMLETDIHAVRIIIVK